MSRQASPPSAVVTQPAVPQSLDPFTITGAGTALLRRPDTGEHYRIDIAVPQGVYADAPPENGWPVLYLLDAGGCFASCVEAMKRMARRSDATAVRPLVIVGISSDAEGYDVPRRQRDFTTPRAKGDLTKAVEPDSSGRADAYLQFLKDSVQPFVAAQAPVDTERQTLFGHSLAGYFALWALVSKTDMFKGYAAISPSVWWDRAELFARAGQLEKPGAHVFICAGEWEDTLPPWQEKAPDSEAVRARRAVRGMVNGAREISALLTEKLGENRVCFRVLAEEDHASIVSAAMAPALRLASRL